MTRLGSMCTGYGGLDLAVAEVLDARHVWHAEVDPDASRVLAHHWPTVPNLGDLRAFDWPTAEPVDVLTAGFPCQPVSLAGGRAGIDDERWLWDDIAGAVGRMDPRPGLLVFENVPGLLTANCGDAMARVVSGLAALGYVGRYRTVRAADIGAAHRRERLFVVAWRADAPRPGLEARWEGRTGGGVAADAASPRHRHPGPTRVGGVPAAAVAGGAGTDGLSLLPTPRATDGTKGGPNQRGSSGDLMLPSAVFHLLPTPTATPYGKSQSQSEDAAVRPSLDSLAAADRWGDYGPAIARWEHVTGRAVPSPTEPGAKGAPRLSARFVEWLMGLREGWVTDHLPRNPALRVLGNGVVPQQARAALWLLGIPSTRGTTPGRNSKWSRWRQPVPARRLNRPPQAGLPAAQDTLPGLDVDPDSAVCDTAPASPEGGGFRG